MKKSLLFVSLILTHFINAQNFSISAKSGDVELDGSLNDINVNAKIDLPLFKKDLAVEFNIGEPKIDKMLDIQMSPADIYMVFETANLTKKDPDVVVESYKKNKDKGWGVIAKELGIKSGSAEFHALKGKAKNKKDKGGKGHGNDKEHGNSHGKGHGKNK